MKNWPNTRKFTLLCIISFGTFAGFSSSLAPQLIIAPLAALYGVNKSSMAYSTSAASAGMVVGGFFFHVFARAVGRPSAMFWSVVGLLLVQLWSALMTKGEDYIPFLVSRGFAGFFGPITGVLGPQMLIDTFFLHQRGRAFTFFFFWFDLGTMAGPTLSGLIADRLGWQSGLWWTVILCGFSAWSIFCFLSGTSWNRARDPAVGAHGSARTWIRGRVDMFFPGSQTMPKTSAAELVSFISASENGFAAKFYRLPSH